MQSFFQDNITLALEYENFININQKQSHTSSEYYMI